MVRLAVLTSCLAGPCLTGPALPPAFADRLVPRSGRPVRGALVRQTDDEVLFNPYWSRNPEMVYEVVRLPAKKVKRVEIEPHPHVEVFRRLAARTEGDGQALLDIAAYAKAEKLKAHARMCLALAVAENPDDAGALARLGGASKWKSVRKGNVHLDPELREALKTYVATEDAEERTRQAAALKKAGFDARPEALERMRRSAGQPTGLTVDRPLSWGSDLFPGAVYTLYVPRAYDPTVPWPLILGLHGGGRDGKKGDEVVGSGDSAMNFYRDLAERHGYLVACPNALRASWAATGNEEMVRALLEELKHLFNVDLDRVYMTGHSMGGFGTWYLGPKMAEDLAAISPMAGGGGGGISELVSTKTPIFIYHSDDDYVSVQSDRTAAKRLQGSGLDFVYTELPGKGHAFPESIRHELFAFFGPRRRHDPRHKDVWPRSSLATGKTTKEEKRYLGDPGAALRGDVETLDDWVDHLRLGGGRAAIAAGRLAEAKPEGAVGAVVKVLKDKRISHDARAWAARALGALGDEAACRSLRKAVVAEAERDQARVAVEAARALAALADAEAGASLQRAIEAWTQYYEDRVTGGKMDFSDWQRAVPTLTALVDARASLPAQGDPRSLDATVVKRVLAAGHVVNTSERVPQDPAAARKALVAAVTRAYDAWDAGADVRERLAEAAGR